jgi:hypothetical protein
MVRDINKLKDIDLNKKVFLVFDDVDVSKLSREEKIHITDLEYDSDMRVLYGVRTIRKGTPRVFTLNYLSKLVKDETEILRRIVKVLVDKPVFINNLNVTINVTPESDPSDPADPCGPTIE